MANSHLSRICMDEEDPMLRFKVRCKHGEVLPLLTSWSKKNPGRRYWACPYYGDLSCKFFRWRDEEVDARSKFILPILVNKIKELEEGLAYQEAMKNKLVDFEEFSDYGIKEKKKDDWYLCCVKAMCYFILAMFVVVVIRSF